MSSAEAKQLKYKELKDQQDEQTKAYLTGVLKSAGGERQRAAELAGLNRTHLQALIKRYSIDIPKNPKATARCKCTRCTEKTESKGGKYVDGKFVCASCMTSSDVPDDKPTPIEVDDETVTTETESGPVRF